MIESVIIKCAKDSNTNIEDTSLGDNFSPLTKAYCKKWREKGYAEEEILLYARLFEHRQDIDWFDPKGWEKNWGIIR